MQLPRLQSAASGLAKVNCLPKMCKASIKPIKAAGKRLSCKLVFPFLLFFPLLTILTKIYLILFPHRLQMSLLNIMTPHQPPQRLIPFSLSVSSVASKLRGESSATTRKVNGLWTSTVRSTVIRRATTEPALLNKYLISKCGNLVKQRLPLLI